MMYFYAYETKAEDSPPQRPRSALVGRLNDRQPHLEYFDKDQAPTGDLILVWMEDGSAKRHR